MNQHIIKIIVCFFLNPQKRQHTAKSVWFIAMVPNLWSVVHYQFGTKCFDFALIFSVFIVIINYIQYSTLLKWISNYLVFVAIFLASVFFIPPATNTNMSYENCFTFQSLQVLLSVSYCQWLLICICFSCTSYAMKLAKLLCHFEPKYKDFVGIDFLNIKNLRWSQERK